MTSFLSRSSQNYQTSPLRRQDATSDVFSELRNFRQESQKKALNSRAQHQGHNTLHQLESPKNNLNQSSTAGPSSQWRTSSMIQSIGKAASPSSKSVRYTSNLSPLKKSSIQIQQLSPARSFLLKSNEVPLNSSNLESLQRDIKDISFSHHFSNQISSLGSNFKGQRVQQSPPRSKVPSSQLSNVISYSPSSQSQKLFSPNRLMKRLTSTQYAQFSDFEFPATHQAEGRRLQRSLSNFTGQQSRKEDLSELLNGTRSQIFSNNIASLSETSNNSKQSNLSQSLLSLNGKINNSNNGSVLRGSQTAAIIDRRAADLESILLSQNHSDFNGLPKQTIERLISLSSTVMSKIKTSSFYKGHYF